ncbi:MAG TPA: sigma factor [Planctomycetota bacterium]|nr:sigma factor [Planctomycetota bacterium]
MNKTDLALLDRFRRARDADAFAEIVTRYQDFVYGTCLRILGNAADSQDVSQECFLRLLRKADTVRTSLGGWLHRCATDLSIDELRGRAARKNREEVSVQMNGHANHESDSAGPSWPRISTAPSRSCPRSCGRWWSSISYGGARRRRSRRRSAYRR